MKTIGDVALVALAGSILGSAITVVSLNSPAMVGAFGLDVVAAAISADEDHRLIQECIGLNENAWCSDEVVGLVHPHLEARLRLHAFGDRRLCEDARDAVSLGGVRTPILAGLWQVKCNDRRSVPSDR